MAKKKFNVKFDHDQPFGRVASRDTGMEGVAYRQGGHYFNSQHEAVKEVPGWSDKKAAEAKKKEAEIETARLAEEAKLAESVLGDLDGVDPHADAQKENAAAEAAEKAVEE
jgi:hypothetical protein